MHLSKKILMSLLVFGLANPTLANTASEKEDPNELYYYLAGGTIAVGAVILAFFKTDAIKGCFKKKPPLQKLPEVPVSVEEQPLMDLKETLQESTELLHTSGDGFSSTNDANAGAYSPFGSNTATPVMETAPIIATFVAAKLGEADPTTRSTTTSSSTAEVGKKQRGQPSPEFLAKMKNLEELYSQRQRPEQRRAELTQPPKRRPLPAPSERKTVTNDPVGESEMTEPTATTASSSTIAKTKSRQFLQQSTKSEVVAELPLDCLPKEFSHGVPVSTEGKTVTNDPVDESPKEELPPFDCPSDTPQPLPVRLYDPSFFKDSNGNIEIPNEGISIPMPGHAVAWILVSEQYGELDDYMGLSLPMDGYTYCFVNSDVNKVIFSGLGETGTFEYGGHTYMWKRSNRSSHSTILVANIDEWVAQENGVEEASHVASPLSSPSLPSLSPRPSASSLTSFLSFGKHEKREKTEAEKRAKQEKQEKLEKLQQEKKEKKDREEREKQEKQEKKAKEKQEKRKRGKEVS